MQPIISISNLSKSYASGFQALKQVNLDIQRGEIFALLGPNGAGKTTLISTICGIVNPSGGRVLVDGHDIVTDYRAARAMPAAGVKVSARCSSRSKAGSNPSIVLLDNVF